MRKSYFVGFTRKHIAFCMLTALLLLFSGAVFQFAKLHTEQHKYFGAWFSVEVLMKKVLYTHTQTYSCAKIQTHATLFPLTPTHILSQSFWKILKSGFFSAVFYQSHDKISHMREYRFFRIQEIKSRNFLSFFYFFELCLSHFFVIFTTVR